MVKAAKLTSAALLTAAVFALALIAPVRASHGASTSSGTGDTNDAFDSVVVISEDSKASVTESMAFTFGEPHHGIVRTVPYVYKNGPLVYKVGYKVLSVTDVLGKPWPYTVTTEGDAFVIRIGDPEVTVTGLQTYVIKYELQGLINHYKDYDEFYFNVIGSDWPLPISNVTVSVHLPSGVAKEQVGAAAYRGADNSTEGIVAEIYDGPIVQFSYRELQAGEGLSIVVDWPSGSVSKPSFLDRVATLISDNWLLSLIAAVIIVTALIFVLRIALSRRRKSAKQK